MSRLLHVLNGDCTRVGVERSGLPGELTVWADVLHEGPTPGGLSRAAWRSVRARHLASLDGQSEQQILEGLRRWDAALDRYREYDEVVFWLEHDLFDQLLLIRHLHWLSTLNDRTSITFSLICIDSFPGVEHFTGLGPLRPEQLATLLDVRVPISERQIAVGETAWDAFCAPEPLRLQQWLHADTAAATRSVRLQPDDTAAVRSVRLQPDLGELDATRSVRLQPDLGELPWLRGGLVRHLQDYPAFRDGLARSERQILTAVDEGALSPVSAFHATQRMEERIYMGDATFWSIMRRLAAARQPLLTITSSDGPSREMLPDAQLELTRTGREVLHGRADHVAINGIDRWMGGVHLIDGRWRWKGQGIADR